MIDGMQILLLYRESEGAQLASLKQILSQFPVTVYDAQGETEALTLAVAHDITLVIIFSTVPQAGFDLAQALHDHPMLQTRPILLALTQAPSEVKEAWLASAFSDLVILPASPDLLKAKLAFLARCRGHMEDIAYFHKLLEKSRTEIDELKRKLKFQITHDQLTQLPNKKLFLDRIGQALAYSARYKTIFAVMYLDIDDLHLVNDAYGHQAGDSVLKEIAERLKGMVRASDSLARVDSDEFILLLSNIDNPQNAGRVAESILQIFQKPFQIGGCERHLTASLGVVLSPNDGKSIDKLLQNADEAMQLSKHKGKNNYQFHQSSLHSKADYALQLMNDFRRALKKEEFLIYFQPQISAGDNRLVGFEALLRWDHPEFGLVPPDHFVSLAEQNGFIVPLGLWIFEKACQLYSKWKKDFNFELHIGVNLSVKQFNDENLVEKLTTVLLKNHMAAENIQLEITESIFADDLEYIVKVLHLMKNIGFSVVMDDFGTGYSCLSYLKNLPIDMLKIDQSFVRSLPEDQNDAAIVRTIVELARNLKITTLAEGIEEEEQRSFLQRIGCQYLQGYLISRPMSETQTYEYLRQHFAGD